MSAVSKAVRPGSSYQTLTLEETRRDVGLWSGWSMRKQPVKVDLLNLCLLGPFCSRGPQPPTCDWEPMGKNSKTDRMARKQLPLGIRGATVDLRSIPPTWAVPAQKEAGGRFPGALSRLNKPSAVEPGAQGSAGQTSKLASAPGGVCMFTLGWVHASGS